MREILFRGKRIDNGEWVYGDIVHNGVDENNCLVQYKAGDSAICMVDIQDKLCLIRKVYASTIGQYTGLTDKNGVKIFEGDIIKSHYANAKKSDFVEYVVFHNGRFCATDDDKHFWIGLADGVKHLPQDKTVYMEWCEVIGNIHDNPELMEAME